MPNSLERILATWQNELMWMDPRSAKNSWKGWITCQDRKMRQAEKKGKCTHKIQQKQLKIKDMILRVSWGILTILQL